MDENLEKELLQRSTAEVYIDGAVNQVTQALSETSTEVDFIIYGERHKESIMPIEEACAKCHHPHFDGDKKRCREFQGKEARARGFTTLICPRQML